MSTLADIIATTLGLLVCCWALYKVISEVNKEE